MIAYNTIQSIARATGELPTRVHYLCRTRGIKPAARIGTTRVFDDATVERIRTEFRKLRQHRRPPTDV